MSANKPIRPIRKQTWPGMYMDDDGIRRAVRRRMAEREMSNYRLAQLAKTTPQLLGDWLNARRHIRSDGLQRIIDALGLALQPRPEYKPAPENPPR